MSTTIDPLTNLSFFNDFGMEDKVYNSANYGSVRIRARRDVHPNLKPATVEKLAAMAKGVGERRDLATTSEGDPGDGAETFVDSDDGNQIASVKDVDVPPGCITVLNTGHAGKGGHVWD